MTSFFATKLFLKIVVSFRKNTKGYCTPLLKLGLPFDCVTLENRLEQCLLPGSVLVAPR